MKRVIILILIVGLLGFVGLRFLTINRLDNAEIILECVLDAYSGERNYLSADIPENIKVVLEEYQLNHIVSDDTTLVLLDNVEDFNNELKLMGRLKDLEDYNNLPPDRDGSEEYIIEDLEGINVEDINPNYLDMFSYDSLGTQDERVIEEDNQYKIRLNDIKTSYNTVDIVSHKGFEKEIGAAGLTVETYSMRKMNPIYKYRIIDVKNSLNKVTYVCASEYDQHIIEIEILYSLFKPQGINII